MRRREVGIGVGGAEVAAIQIHGKPRVVDGLNKFNQRFG